MNVIKFLQVHEPVENVDAFLHTLRLLGLISKQTSGESYKKAFLRFVGNTSG